MHWLKLSSVDVLGHLEAQAGVIAAPVDDPVTVAWHVTLSDDDVAVSVGLRGVVADGMPCVWFHLAPPFCAGGVWVFLCAGVWNMMIIHRTAGRHRRALRSQLYPLDTAVNGL